MAKVVLRENIFARELKNLPANSVVLLLRGGKIKEDCGPEVM